MAGRRAGGKGDQAATAETSLGTLLTLSFVAVLILAVFFAVERQRHPAPQDVATRQRPLRPVVPAAPAAPAAPVAPVAPGTLEISVDDLNVEMLVTGEGKSIVSPGGTWNHLLSLRPGKYRYTARRHGQVVGGGETFIEANRPQRVQMFVGSAPEVSKPPGALGLQGRYRITERFGDPAPPAIDLGSWGRFVDPKGGSRVLRDGDRGTISMPADTPRDLNPTVNNTDAPRVVTDIVGDFKFEVTVPPFPMPDAAASVDGGGNVYHWFGPVVWGDESNFFRFGVGRSTVANDGAPDDVFECFRGGREISLEGSAAHAGTTHFQVERRGNTLFVRRSTDGQRWSAFRTCSLVGLPARLQVGVAAVNTGNDAFAPEFVGWRLRPRDSAAPGPGGSPIPATAPDLGPWGHLVTPIADCRAVRDGDRLTIEMPANAPCDLNPAPEKDIAAPRLLRAVEGDFTIRTKVAQFARPRRDSGAAPREQTYLFAGLLIWADERNFLRFGINANTDYEGGAPCLDLEFFRNLRDITGDVRRAQEGSRYFQAERRGNTLSLKTSDDGVNWSSYRTCSLAGLAGTVHVGVVAINTGTGPFAAEFEEWSFRSANSAASGADGGQAPSAAPDPGPWGRLVDPEGGSKVERRGERLTITAPGDRPRDLSPTPGYNLDAPRVLRPVTGDFVAEVTILPFPRAGREATDAGKPNAYHGAGLVVWADGRNLLRFDRASLFGSDDGAPHLHLELFRDAQVAETELRWTAEAPTHLQVERRGDTLFARTSVDGRTWDDYKACSLPGMVREVQVGVVAINTDTKDFSPRFEGWSLRPTDPGRP